LARALQRARDGRDDHGGLGEGKQLVEGGGMWKGEVPSRTWAREEMTSETPEVPVATEAKQQTSERERR